MNMNEKGKIDPMLAMGLVIGLIIGLLGGYAATNTILKPETPQQNFSDKDKNFLTNLANQQVIANLNNLGPIIDWCTINGGTWDYQTQPVQKTITEQDAKQLEAQGISVTQNQDGSWAVNLTLITRNCVIPQPKTTQTQQQTQTTQQTQ